MNPAFLSWAPPPQAKLVRYICKQRQCKLSVAPGERPSELNSYPRFSDWLYTFNVRPEAVQVRGPGRGGWGLGGHAREPHPNLRTSSPRGYNRGEGDVEAGA